LPFEYHCKIASDVCLTFHANKIFLKLSLILKDIIDNNKQYNNLALLKLLDNVSQCD